MLVSSSHIEALEIVRKQAYEVCEVRQRQLESSAQALGAAEAVLKKVSNQYDEDLNALGKARDRIEALDMSIKILKKELSGVVVDNDE